VDTTASTAPPQPADEVAELRSLLDATKAELDALQTHVLSEDKRGWSKHWPNVATILVAALTLAFSIWVNQGSAERLAEQDRHAARAELRELLQRLQALPVQNFQNNRTYADDPEAQSFLGGAIQGETVLLAQQAAGLIDELEGEAGADEYAQVAYALTNAGYYQEADGLVVDGLAVVDNAQSLAGLLRQGAIIRFAMGDIEGGRARWQEALEVFDRFPDETAYAQAFSLSFTEAMWAHNEILQGDCETGALHLVHATDLARTLDSSPWVQQNETFYQQRCGPGAN
jgi:hypothetical protein